MTEASGKLLHNLLLFGRVLRGLGIDTSPEQATDLLRALDRIEIGRKSEFFHAARCIYVHRREQLPLFHQAFEEFWRKPVDEWTTLDLRAMGERRHYRTQQGGAKSDKKMGERPSADGETEETVVEARLTYSAREILRYRDFGDISGEETEAIKRMMDQFVWRLGARRSRRKRPSGRSLLDLRRTLRRNLRFGGELLRLEGRRAKSKARPLVILADISGSMERYTRLLLHFVYGLAAGLDQQVEAFVFSTRLTRITRQLRGRDAERALREVSERVVDWSGGTRIGDAIKAFNFQWARRVLGHGAVVLLISDGWDRGDIELLGQEMARLQRSCHRLIWLNPLLGSPEYEPLTRGMQAALPFVDDFLPIHNLASLEDLAKHLELLDGRRPTRRRGVGTSRHSPASATPEATPEGP